MLGILKNNQKIDDNMWRFNERIRTL